MKPEHILEELYELASTAEGLSREQQKDFFYDLASAEGFSQEEIKPFFDFRRSLED